MRRLSLSIKKSWWGTLPTGGKFFAFAIRNGFCSSAKNVTSTWMRKEEPTSKGIVDQCDRSGLSIAETQGHLSSVIVDRQALDKARYFAREHILLKNTNWTERNEAILKWITYCVRPYMYSIQISRDAPSNKPKWNVWVPTNGLHFRASVVTSENLKLLFRGTNLRFTLTCTLIEEGRF